MTKKRILVKKNPPTNDIELTKRYTDSKEAVSKNIQQKSNGNAVLNDKQQGLNIDTKTNSAKAVPFKRTHKTVGMWDIIYGDDGTIISKTRTGSTASEKAKKQSDAKEADVNTRRSVNEKFVNNNYTEKKDRTDEEKQQLIRLGKAVVPNPASSREVENKKKNMP